jgi:hypothetical protein
MAKKNRKLNTNGRVVSEMLTNYRDTFRAFTELINNAIQADATEIRINVIHSQPVGKLFPDISSIEVMDNGKGVSLHDFDQKIFEVGTTVKPGGHGVGRFSALQIGETMEIETVAWDESISKHTKVKAKITATALKNQKLTEIDFPTEEEIIVGKSQASYYKVIISNLYQNISSNVHKSNQLSEYFLPTGMPFALSHYYIYEIFNNKVKFFINGDSIEKERFVIGEPTIIKKDFESIRGGTHPVQFQIYNIQSELNKVKLFTVLENSGIKTVSNEYTYSSDYYSPELGTWFIYLESDLFKGDLFRNVLMDAFGDEELQHFKSLIRITLNDFFKEKNTLFSDFIERLNKDTSNPFLHDKPVSETHELIFNKIAYLVETEYKILDRGDNLKDLVYDLVNKSIKNGKVQDLFSKLIKMKEPTVDKFNNLMEITDVESVIQFSAQVADKISFLDFLHDITYGKVSKVLRERSQLHKIIEKNLWLFGENYTQTPHLWSDRKIGSIFNEIHEKTMAYEPTDNDENLVESKDQDFNDITDLFFYNEKITGDEVKEFMIIELKAPKCKISQKELNQIDRYAFQIESASGLPTENTKYKLILISSDITPFAKSKLKSARENFTQPFLFDKKIEKNIEVYVMTWAELIELNKRKLNYLSSKLVVKDKSVSIKFEEEYPQLLSDKVNSQLRLIQLKA